MWFKMCKAAAVQIINRNSFVTTCCIIYESRKDINTSAILALLEMQNNRLFEKKKLTSFCFLFLFCSRFGMLKCWPCLCVELYKIKLATMSWSIRNYLVHVYMSGRHKIHIKIKNKGTNDLLIFLIKFKIYSKVKAPLQHFCIF